MALENFWLRKYQELKAEILLQSEAVEYKTASMLKSQTIGLLKADNKRLREALEKIKEYAEDMDDDKVVLWCEIALKKE